MKVGNYIGHAFIPSQVEEPENDEAQTKVVEKE